MRKLLLDALNNFVIATNAAMRGNSTDPSVEESYVRLANLILSVPDETKPLEETLPQ